MLNKSYWEKLNQGMEQIPENYKITQSLTDVGKLVMWKYLSMDKQE